MSGRENWGSRIGFIVAASGSAIGLGNIWKFPYIAGHNGGGAFVLVYLLCIGLIGLTLIIAEVLIGHASQKAPTEAFQALEGRKTRSAIIGWCGAISGFCILSFYSVVGGWCLAYLLHAFTDAFSGKSVDAVNALFGSLYSSGELNLVWHAVFMAICIGIVIKGVRRGLERWTKILMPILGLLLLVMVGYAATTSGFNQGLRFIFNPNFSELSANGVVIALGHAFFTLSLGMGAMITYGSYLPKGSDIPASASAVVFFDTLIALLACIAIFPIVFSHGFEPSAGPGLVFKTLPVIFSKLIGGQFLAILFFALLAFAAITSAISLLEVVVCCLIDRMKMSRLRATTIMGSAVFLMGVPSALSGSTISHLTFPDWVPLFGRLMDGLNFFDSVDYVISNWLMPIGGLLLALYLGWRYPEGKIKKYFFAAKERPRFYCYWRFAIRYLAPALLVLIFLNLIGVLKLTKA